MNKSKFKIIDGVRYFAEQPNTCMEYVCYYYELAGYQYIGSDRIMATEMSFLQAQIKPHFLYNALL